MLINSPIVNPITNERIKVPHLKNEGVEVPKLIDESAEVPKLIRAIMMKAITEQTNDQRMKMPMIVPTGWYTEPSGFLIILVLAPVEILMVCQIATISPRATPIAKGSITTPMRDYSKTSGLDERCSLI